ncbi:MAG: NAD(P)H-hydrate dehydratase [Deltaproteobacteria bacterium]|nr:NAD(P)H-hydrate dehydratase [Deltaproteobacteria bacterium]MBW2413830.1 NAD(P)H-hydrate dehydratase [Deltaproteobacteria bacterium]
MNARILDERGWPCPTGDEMGRIDRDAISRLGIPGRVLMETAGRQVAQAVRLRFPATRRPLILCGGGNNGGDGYVVARLLRDADDRVEPVVMTLGDAERHSEEARANLGLLAQAEVEVVRLRDLKPLEHALARCDLVIDAVFGTGVSRAVEGLAAAALGAVAAADVPVVAVDLPSGLSSETGSALGPEPRADLIVTLGLPKLGLAARADLPEILVADIGLPWTSVERAGVRQFVLTDRAAARRLPERVAAGHKGTFGHVLVVAGSPGKTGAAVLAARGALRSGAGLVTVAAPESLNAIFEAKLTEAMTLPLASAPADPAPDPAVDPAIDPTVDPTVDPDGTLGAGAVPLLVDAARSRDSLVLGPGLGTAPGTVEAVAALLSAYEGAAVVDADGLNAFAGRADGLRGPGPRVLTPHPGEAARLLETSVGEVQADRVAAARRLAERSGAVVVLKGARTVVSDAAGQCVWLNPTGGPGLASGGTGDVLAGVIGALLAQGSAPLDAAVAGVYLHGRAGDQGGRVGGLASEVAERIPAVWQALARVEKTDDEPSGLRRFP